MPNRDIIVVGTSLGGVGALKTFVSGLPDDLPAAVFIVLHMGAYSPGILPEILAPATTLPVGNARDRAPIESGHIYIAPPDHHLILESSGQMRITRGPRENRSRPAVDPLFRTAAFAFGPRVIGVILTGMLDDGTAGLWAVKECGGVAIVQNPQEALAPEMPLNALKHVEVNHCLALEKIPPLLVQLTRAPADQAPAQKPSPTMQTEVLIAAEQSGLASGIEQWGEPSTFTCPECHGALLQLTEGNLLRFRCHTGHGYSLESLLAEYTEKSEDTLWSAVRALQEKALLMRRAADHLAEHGHEANAEALRQKADGIQRRADRVRENILQSEQLDEAPLLSSHSQTSSAKGAS